MRRDTKARDFDRKAKEAIADEWGSDVYAICVIP